MNKLTLFVCLALSAFGLLADQDATEPSEAMMQALGTLNGQALACRQFAAAKEAKTLMIRHAPKTQRYGALFEQATNESFIAQAKGSVPCPTDEALSAQLVEIAAKLQVLLPTQNPESGS